MTDMLVKLYDHTINRQNRHSSIDIKIRRALAIDTEVIRHFVLDNFSDICKGWVDECTASLYRHPVSCYIATHNGGVVGFACYDGTAKGMVGPVGVNEKYRKKGIATDLLNHCFNAMKEEGYAYAVIGWVSSEAFYEKSCSAIAIPDSFPGVYGRMVMEHKNDA